MPSLPPIIACDLPSDALLMRYREAGAYTDCYATHSASSVSLGAFIEAFYTTGLFALERHILRWFLSLPSTDAEVRQLAADTNDRFAAWRTESRTATQILLADVSGGTRSWLMIAPGHCGASSGTTLYFGSAVLARQKPGSARPAMSWKSRAVLGFHRLYSRALLRAATRRLQRVLSA